MVNRYTYNYMIDGTRNTIVNVHIDADGSGNESARVLIDMSALNSPQLQMKMMKLAWTAGTGTRALLFFGDVGGNHERFFETPEQTAGEMDWTVAGGRRNVNVADPTGDIVFTTVGMDDAADYLYLTLWFKKIHKTTHQPAVDSNAFGYSR